jgi:hypothetical protein
MNTPEHWPEAPRTFLKLSAGSQHTAAPQLGHPRPRDLPVAWIIDIAVWVR